MTAKQKGLLFVAACAASVAFAQTNDIGRFDPRMAEEKSAVDTNGVKWIDGRYLPLEGKCFSDVEAFYDRLPSNVTERVNVGVRNMKHHTAGMQFRFRTDSRALTFKWVPYYPELSMGHMPATGMSGIDVYRQDAGGKWKYVKTGRIAEASGAELRIQWTPGDACLVNLPLYSGIIGRRLSAAGRVPRRAPWRQVRPGFRRGWPRATSWARRLRLP